ncbi:MAG: hypothetical protein B6D39_12020 [Anaerolineae bacterium UTCFX2]|jgi:hypothetical protein|nr:GreA/GreB family elongation factor [Anaerolineales bacterium]OQY87932.1 MAG: hypothetical protein B6D39_12020 [Anaerolineae bacterium UTCFX2]
MSEEQPTQVAPGYMIQVEISYTDGAERLEFVIVDDDQADFQAGFLGEGTPLAQAILGALVGAQIPYFVGDARQVTILSAKPTERTPQEDAAARREELHRQAVEQADRISAMMFASSFSGKWGDYDPDAVEKQKDT